MTKKCLHILVTLGFLLFFTACSDSKQTNTELTNNDENTTTITTPQEPEVINGYTLPPEPDPQQNNATLLGIDSNNNGVRDDVERWTIMTYKDKHKIVTEVGLQGARAAQIIIQEPEKALETDVLFTKAVDCSLYFQYDVNVPLINKFMWGDTFNKVQFNTAKRARAYDQYNATLSGHVFNSPTSSQAREGCDFNVTKLLEENNITRK